MTKTRFQQARALEAWADTVEPEELVVADTDALRVIAVIAARREELDADLVESVCSARQARRSWSEIGAMLGPSIAGRAAEVLQGCERAPNCLIDRGWLPWPRSGQAEVVTTCDRSGRRYHGLASIDAVRT